MLTCDLCAGTIEDGETVFTPDEATHAEYPTQNNTPHAGHFHLKCAMDGNLVPDEVRALVTNGTVPYRLVPPEDR